MSIKPQYVSKMLSGSKTVELRTRKINLPKGSKLWIYSTLPDGCINAYGIIEDVVFDNIVNIWKQFSSEIGITKKEFDQYTKGKDKVSVIRFTKIKPLKKVYTLTHLRDELENFQPPQFFVKLPQEHPIRLLLNS